MNPSAATQISQNSDLFEKNFSDLITRIPATVSMSLPAAKISNLLDQTLSALPKTEHTPILCIASAHTNEGAGRIAINLSLLAAQRSGVRILFIDAGTTTRGKRETPKFDLPATIYAFLTTPQKSKFPITRLEKTNLYVAALGEQTASHAPQNADTFTHFINDCKNYFDLIIVTVDDALTSPDTLRLARISDGILISARAEKSRLPVLSHLKLLLARTETPIIGTALYARRRYIPAFLYRLIFRG